MHLERRTSFSNANDVAILQTDGDRLPLNRRRLFVADLIYNLENLSRNGRLLP